MNQATTICPDDAWRVEVAAHRLGISEFELFETAYRDWHPHEPSIRELEKHFVKYLFTGIAPVWVRGFVRRHVPAEVLARIDASTSTDVMSLLSAFTERSIESTRVLLQMLLPRPAPSQRTRRAASLLEA